MTTSDRKTQVNLLDTIPVHSSHVKTEWKDGHIVLAFPRFKQAWMRRFLQPKGMSPYLHVELEEHGTAVWQLIDGRRTVSQIVELLASHFDGKDGYTSRVTTYIQQLSKDGFVRLMAGRHAEM